MANKVRREIRNGYLYKNNVCNSKRLNIRKTVQRNELNKTNELHL